MTTFRIEADRTRFADDLLSCLRDTYYVWTEETNSWMGKVQKAQMLRGYWRLPVKAEETFTGQAISHAIQEMRYKGWKNISNHHEFKEAAIEAGFAVREFYGTTVITL